MTSLRKLASVFILGVPFALLGCAMGVDDANPDDSASLEASESQATGVELQAADLAPELESTQAGWHCRERCWRQYRRCEAHFPDFDRGGRRDRCWWRYQRCLRSCHGGPRPFDHGGPGHGGPDHDGPDHDGPGR